jgi:hypothetical protein
VFFRHENDFSSDTDLVDFVKSYSIDRVLFLTPYGNSKRLRLYQLCRDSSIPYAVFDRGALPDSWFFDPAGFNADSASYDPSLWRRALTPGETYETELYLHELCSSDDTLEANGPRRGAEALRKNMGLGSSRVIFVPLQRPNDSVIRHFSGRVEGIDDFLKQIVLLSAQLPSDWRIVVKQHPLESHDVNIPGVVVLPNDTHVYDAIELSDAVVLINSGVGLLSLCFGKPTFCFGDSFYAHDGLAHAVSTAEEIRELLTSRRGPNTAAVRQFIHYLIKRFYSFATTKYVKVDDGNGSSRNVAICLNFYQLIIPDQEPITMNWRAEPFPTSSPLYDYYGAYLRSRSARQPATTKPANIKSVARNATGTSAVTASQGIHDVGPSALIPTNKHSRALKKLRKLFRSPRQYFRDALSNRSTR